MTPLSPTSIKKWRSYWKSFFLDLFIQSLQSETCLYSLQKATRQHHFSILADDITGSHLSKWVLKQQAPNCQAKLPEARGPPLQPKAGESTSEFFHSIFILYIHSPLTISSWDKEGCDYGHLPSADEKAEAGGWASSSNYIQQVDAGGIDPIFLNPGLWLHC